MKKFKIALTAIVSFSSAASAADQFDLVCSGVDQYVGKRPKQNERRYIIDLKAGFWCYRDSTARADQKCYDIRPFEEVTPSRLFLEKSDPHKQTKLHYIDHETGEYTDFDVMFSVDEGGKCKPAPFSGLPNTAKF